MEESKETPTPHNRVGVSLLWVRNLENWARVRVSRVLYYVLTAVWPVVTILGLPWLFDSMVFINLGLIMLTMSAICRLAIIEYENHIEANDRIERLEAIYSDFLMTVERVGKENSEG